MAFTVGDLVTYLRMDNTPFRAGLISTRTQMRLLGNDLGRESDALGHNWAQRFIHRVSGTMREMRRPGSDLNRTMRDMGRNLLNFGDDVDGNSFRRRIGSMMDQASAAVTSGMTNMMSAGTNLSTNIWSWIPAIATFIGWLFAVGPAVYMAGGTLATLPGLIAGVGIAFATVKFAMKGITEAFQDAGGGGGGAADQIHAVQQATQALARAQKEAKKAADAINTARAAEIKRLRDLNIELRRNAIDEKQAASAVAKARDELARARGTGDINAITEADLAYQDALLTLETTRNRTKDLAEEKSEADRLGVEGSDQVQAALERQQASVESLAEAEYNLRKAREGSGGGGAAAELIKLAPAAQDFVDKVKSLKGAFSDLRMEVQEKFFKGLGDKILKLANAWLPALRRQMGGMAETLNTVISFFTASASRPKFIADMEVGMKAVRDLIEQVGKTIGGPFMEAFATLARAAAPVIGSISAGLAKMIRDFSNWIKDLDKSGSLTSFMEEAAIQVSFLFDVLIQLLRIIGQVAWALTRMQPTSMDSQQTRSPVQTLAETLKYYADWLADPANQETIQRWIQEIKDYGKWLIEEGIPNTLRFFQTLQQWMDRIMGWANTIEGWADTFQNALDDVQTSVSNFRQSISDANPFSGMWGSFRNNMNNIINAWNRLSFSLPSFSAFGASFGGFSVETPDIRGLATGAMVGHRPGGTIARVGEGSEDEMIAPLSKAQAMMTHAVVEAMGRYGGQGGDVVIVIDGEIIERKSLDAVRRNPSVISAATKQGTRARTFAGGTKAKLNA